MSAVELILMGIAAVAGGAVNALAGGGTLITFPMLTAVGVPAVAANITNTVALCPGYLGATFAQRGDLKGQKRRLLLLLPAAAAGGIGGGLLLLLTGEQAFRRLVPYLILLAVGLLSSQDHLRTRLQQRIAHHGAKDLHEAWSLIPVIPAAVYGGYFGAGVSVIVLAVLGLAFDDSLTRLNALKQALSFGINIAAAVFFLFSGKVVWTAAVVMALGAVAGGVLGGRLAGRIKPSSLRRVVVAAGFVIALIYFAR